MLRCKHSPFFSKKFSPGARTELEVELAKRFLAQYRRFEL